MMRELNGQRDRETKISTVQLENIEICGGAGTIGEVLKEAGEK
jgi:hypothetical protein